MFATKPQLAGALLARAQSAGIRAAFVAGDEVYGGRELRRDIRQRGMGYVMAVRANHALTTGSGRTMTAAGAAGMIPSHAWHRMRTGSGTKGTRHYDWAMLEVTSDDTPAGTAAGTASCWPGGTAIPASCRTTGARKIISSLSRWPAWTPGRSSAGGPGTAGPRSACSPTSTFPSRSRCNASKTPAQTWTPG